MFVSLRLLIGRKCSHTAWSACEGEEGGLRRRRSAPGCHCRYMTLVCMRYIAGRFQTGVSPRHRQFAELLHLSLTSALRSISTFDVPLRRFKRPDRRLGALVLARLVRQAAHVVTSRRVLN